METQDIKMKFGKYKGTMLKHLPLDYLLWGVRNEIFKGTVMIWAKIRTMHPKDTYQVTVENAIVGSNVYNVQAYSESHAISIVKKNKHIQNSQSGTIYSAIKLKRQKP